jgi:transposase-like protein
MATRDCTSCTPERKTLALEAIAEGLTMGEAAARAGISRRTLFNWKADDPEFKAEIDAAYQAGTDVLEAEARRRGVGQY